MTCLRMPVYTLAFAVGMMAFPWAWPAEAACCTLTRAEWQCLQARLDRYDKEPVDPVLASVLRCNQPETVAPISTRQDPSIVPRTSPEGDKDAARKVFFLPKAQIGCL